jgi:hypothetical protein
MEPPDPEAYREASYDQLLALARAAKREEWSKGGGHPDLGPLKEELRELARGPLNVEELPLEQRARLDELNRLIDAYPIHDPWAIEAGRVLLAIYHEAARRGEQHRMASDLGISQMMMNLYLKLSHPGRVKAIAAALEAGLVTGGPPAQPGSPRSIRWSFRRRDASHG